MIKISGCGRRTFQVWCYGNSLLDFICKRKCSLLNLVTLYMINKLIDYKVIGGISAAICVASVAQECIDLKSS